MRGRTIVVAVVSIFMLLSVVQAASAYPRDMSPTQLEGFCNERNGKYFPPDVNCTENCTNCCLLPDDTLVCCGGAIAICTSSFTTPGGHSSMFDSLILQTQLNIQTKLNDISTQLNTLQSICTGTTGTILLQ